MLEPRDCTLDVGVSAPGRIARAVDVLRADGSTDSRLLDANGSTRLVLERLRRGEHWSVSIRFDDGASKSTPLVGCPTRQGVHELAENVHVVLAPH
jgi:hypothetical protein